MPQSLVDALWRDSDAAPTRRARGPRSRHTTGDVVTRAIAIADESGLDALSIRTLAASLGITPMAVYTHVSSRDDLLVLMADAAHTRMDLAPFGRSGWRERVRQVAQDNRALVLARPWLLEVDDPRLALGPGTIAKYDHELHAFDGTGLTDLDRDAALTFVLDFARSSTARLVRAGAIPAFASTWEESAERLATYVGTDFPLAQSVGRAAGEAMGGPYDAEQAWEFGLARVVAGLAELVEPDGAGS